MTATAPFSDRSLRGAIIVISGRGGVQVDSTWGNKCDELRLLGTKPIHHPPRVTPGIRLRCDKLKHAGLLSSRVSNILELLDRDCCTFANGDLT